MLNDEILRSAAVEVQQFLTESVPEEDTSHQFSEDFERKMKKAIRRQRMKRWLPTAIYLTVALVIVVSCLFMDSNVLWQVPPSDEAKERLDQEMILQYNDSINWECPTKLGGDPYYGSINGCMIFRTLQWSAWDVEIGRIQVAGYIFYWNGPLRIYAYRDGEFCLLEEAYERGWLTEAHIGKIYQEHQERIALWPDETQEVFQELFEQLEERLQGK